MKTRPTKTARIKPADLFRLDVLTRAEEELWQRYFKYRARGEKSRANHARNAASRLCRWASAHQKRILGDLGYFELQRLQDARRERSAAIACRKAEIIQRRHRHAAA